MPGRLQRELKQSKPFAAPEVEAYLNLVRTADQLSRAINAMLKPFDLTASQYNVLRILRGTGEAGLPCGEIGARLVTYDPDVTRLLDRLERRGLVARARSDEDRRVVIVRLTAAGSTLLTRTDLDTKLLEMHRRHLGHLGREQLATLIECCEAVRERLDARPAPVPPVL